jgi:replicative DNA helicase
MGVVKKTVIDMGEERRILTHMIVSSEFLDSISSFVDPRLFDSSYIKILAKWIMEFYQISKVAPGKAIQDIWRAKQSELSEDDQKLVGELIQSLSEDWSKGEPNNVPYTSETAKKFFKIQSLKKLAFLLQESISAGDTAGGERSVANFKRIEKVQGQGIDLLKEENFTEIYKAYTMEDEVLFHLPGAYGEMVGPICRGDFVGVLAPKKTGKTWTLMHMAMTAYLSGLDVLFVSLEMMKPQTIRRFWSMLEGRPYRDREIKLPMFHDFDDCSRIEFQREYRKGVEIDPEIIKKSQKTWRKSIRGSLRLEIFPTNSFAPKDMETLLSNLQLYENYSPNVIVIDYLDIMVPDKHISEERHKLNQIWLYARGLAQERQIAVISASQTGRKTVGGKEVQESDVSEDIRKLAHLTKAITLNATEKEKANGIIRANQKTQREGATDFRQVCILQCLDISRFYLDSRWCEQVYGLDEYRGQVED